MQVDHFADDGSFAYDGRWEHVRGIEDGRHRGQSSRSFHPGSGATLNFEGRFVRLYGVVGPGGGRGLVEVDGGRERRIATFTSARKRADVVVFESGPLPPGRHRLRLAVLPPAPGMRGRYVNVDGAAYGG
jgi:hypothetical protein